MAASAIVAASQASALPFIPKHPAISKNRVQAGDWRLDISHNAFSGEVACRLRAKNGQAFYQSGAVGFRFRKSWDVHDAVYRLDGGEPHQWREDLPELVRIGARIDSGGITNASAGIVWIPWDRLSEANSIAIQPRLDRRAVVFHFRGVRGLLADAVARGCTPDSRFVR